jgi:hypothetical protein
LRAGLVGDQRALAGQVRQLRSIPHPSGDRRSDRREAGSCGPEFFWSTGVSIAHVDLLDALGREVVFENLRLGHVLDASGKPLPNFRTFQPVRTAFIRGSKSSGARRCMECHRILYAPVNMPHLVGEEREFTGLWGANLSATLIIDDSIRPKLAGKRFPKMSMFRINVLSEPIDGHPANLEDLTPGPSTWSSV